MSFPNTSPCPGGSGARGCVHATTGRVSGRSRGVPAEGRRRGLHPLLRMRALRRKD